MYLKILKIKLRVLIRIVFWFSDTVKIYLPSPLKSVIEDRLNFIFKKVVKIFYAWGLFNFLKGAKSKNLTPLK